VNSGEKGERRRYCLDKQQRLSQSLTQTPEGRLSGSKVFSTLRINKEFLKVIARIPFLCPTHRSHPDHSCPSGGWHQATARSAGCLWRAEQLPLFLCAPSLGLHRALGPATSCSGESCRWSPGEPDSRALGFGGISTRVQASVPSPVPQLCTTHGTGWWGESGGEM
jgi:hypothetical protein